METIVKIIIRKRPEIDSVATAVLALPNAVTGDVLALSSSITRMVREHLQQIAKRTVKPEEH